MATQTMQGRVTGKQNTVLGGLPLRTDVRAGFSWDELDDQAAALWNQLSGAASNAISGLTGGTSSTNSTSSTSSTAA